MIWIDLGYHHFRNPRNGLAIHSSSKVFLQLFAGCTSDGSLDLAEDRQHQMFVQRLREVAYVQSKARIPAM